MLFGKGGSEVGLVPGTLGGLPCLLRYPGNLACLARLARLPA